METAPGTDDGRRHHVTALVVAYEGQLWLPRTLAALAGQERPPDVTVAVDAGSHDDSAGLLRQALPLVLVAAPDTTDTPARAQRSGLPRALAEATALAQREADLADPAPGSAEPVRWYWLIHDDSAPDPDCLAQLLAGADRNRSSHVLVPKTVAWADHGRLVGIGNRWSPGTPTVESLEPRERDQGQHDVDRDVYSGSSAGLLIRADDWHRLGGFDAALGGWAAPADLCRRVWGSGASVTFIPQAVLAHRRAGRTGARARAPGTAAPRRRERESQLLLELTRGSAWSVAPRYLRAWVATLVRAIALLLTHEPEEASAELAGAWDVLGHPRRVRAGRRRLRAAASVASTRPAHVRAYRGAVVHGVLDDWLAGPRARRRQSGWRPSPRVWRPALLTAILVAAAALREPGTLFGSGTLRGGGLLPAPGSGELLGGYLGSWHDVGLGTGAGLPPYLPILAVAGLPLLGSVDLGLRLAFGLAAPLAFLSAYLSMGPTRFGPWRTVLAVVWAFLPAGVAAAGDGRISTLALLLLAPPTARAATRALVAARAGRAGIRPTIVAGVLLGLTAAFAPTGYLVTAVAAIVAWLVAGCPRWALRTGGPALILGGFFAVLWVPRLVAAPWLLLTDLGRTDPTLGAPSAPVWGLSPGGPGAVWWAGVPLLVVAVLAALGARTGRARLVVVAACLTLALVAWLPAAARALWPPAAAERAWPGQLLMLASAALAVSVASLANRPGRRAELVGTGLVVAAGVLAVGWWVAPVGLGISASTGQPPVVTLAEESADRPRALVVTRSGTAVVYGVATTTQTRLGDADALADDLDGQGLTPVVQGLVSGTGVDAVTELGGRAIRYVVFDGPPGDELVAELDATTGLRRLASSEDQSLWLVSGDPARALLIADAPGTGDPNGTGQEPVAQVGVPVSTVPTSVDVFLHPQLSLPRTLLVAELAHPGWVVTLGGREVDPGMDGQGMLTAPVGETGTVLRVHHEGPWPWLAAAQLLGMLVAVVLALPKVGTADPFEEAAG